MTTTTTYFNSRYGPIPIGREDITERSCLSIDLRNITAGTSGYDDETRFVQPGTFSLSVFESCNEEHPVGEIRLIHEGVEVSMVGALTNRPGIFEITPDHVTAAKLDDNYLSKMLLWIKPSGYA